jgi:outer membrane immunogenic protein
MRTLFAILISTVPMITLAHPENPKNWSGVYLGPNFGGVFNRISMQAQHNALSNNEGKCFQKNSFSSVFLGGQLGAKHQLNSNIVFGVEGDYTYHFNNFSIAQCDCEFQFPVYDQFKLSNRFQTSIRGQLGYALTQYNVLPFFSAGASFADLGITYSNEASNTYSKFSMQPGYVLGGGLDWAYSEKFTLRLEYYYNQYNQLKLNMPNIYDIIDSSGLARMNIGSNNIRLALNYWIY